MNFGEVSSAGEAFQVPTHPDDVGAVGFDVDADEPRPLHLEGDDRAGKGRPVDQHRIAGLQEEAAGEVEGGLAATRDDDILAFDPNRIAFEESEHRLHQGRFAGDRGVLHDAVDV